MNSMFVNACNNLHEECGVFGIYSNNGDYNAEKVYHGLYALQHRGQESCGIAVSSNGIINCHKGMGLVPEVFNPDVISKLKGEIAIGHVRYSTTGSSSIDNAQPLLFNCRYGQLALAHNGNIMNSDDLIKKLNQKGSIFHSTTDSELIAHLIAYEQNSGDDIEDTLIAVSKKLKGAFALTMICGNKLIGVRDPWGIRPLSIGKINDGYVLASETCALDTIDAEFIRDVEPGEIVVIENNEIKSIKNTSKGKSHLCIFEYIYFARPDSFLEGISVYEARKRIGQFLAIEHPVDADIVMGVPDSGITSAIGYAEQSGIPYGEGLLKNRYIGRTFIQPTQIKREQNLKIKLSVLKNNVKNKRIILIDDSIVRGTTIKRIVKLLKEAGAKEVHIRISSPQFKYPCYFGTDVPSKEQLIANTYDLKEMCKMLDVDTIGHISIENLKKAINNTDCSFCDGCFSGNYPVKETTKKEVVKMC